MQFANAGGLNCGSILSSLEFGNPSVNHADWRELHLHSHHFLIRLDHFVANLHEDAQAEIGLG